MPNKNAEVTLQLDTIRFEQAAKFEAEKAKESRFILESLRTLMPNLLEISVKNIEEYNVKIHNSSPRDIIVPDWQTKVSSFKTEFESNLKKILAVDNVPVDYDVHERIRKFEAAAMEYQINSGDSNYIRRYNQYIKVVDARDGIIGFINYVCRDIEDGKNIQIVAEPITSLEATSKKGKIEAVNLNELPEEIFCNVFSFFNLKETFSAGRASKFFNNLVWGSDALKKFLLEHGIKDYDFNLYNKEKTSKLEQIKNALSRMEFIIQNCKESLVRFFLVVTHQNRSVNGASDGYFDSVLNNEWKAECYQNIVWASVTQPFRILSQIKYPDFKIDWKKVFEISIERVLKNDRIDTNDEEVLFRGTARDQVKLNLLHILPNCYFPDPECKKIIELLITKYNAFCLLKDPEGKLPLDHIDQKTFPETYEYLNKKTCPEKFKNIQIKI